MRALAMGFLGILLAVLMVTPARSPLHAQDGAQSQSSKLPSRQETDPQTRSIIEPQPPSPSPPSLQWRIANTYPHDAGAFTQGMVYDGGFLYESTGLNGGSTLRKVELKTGKVLNISRLPYDCFGEGLALWRTSLVQLTWRSGRAFVYDKETFAKQKEHSYRGEGWGITENGTSLIMSDGTSILRFLSPDTFTEERRIEVRDHDEPVANLNELEYVKGEIFANIWREDRVARVSPETGEVLGWIDFGPLRNELSPMQRVDVLNGMAYDPENDRLYVTGKLWPKLFEIELRQPAAGQPR